MACGDGLISRQYRLRSSGPFPIGGGINQFVIHTFMAEDREVTTYEATGVLITSADMSGQAGEYESASYTGLPYTNEGGLVFSGQEVKRPDYIEEEAIPGN